MNHKDENKENNNVNNLEWCTPKYNTNYGTRTERAIKSSIGKIISKETREKLSKSLKGHVVTDKTRQKMSDSLSKPIYQYDINMNLIRIWKNAQEPKKELNYDPANINRCCRGVQKTYKKYIWKKRLDYDSLESTKRKTIFD